MTGGVQCFTVDTHVSRLQRMRSATLTSCRLIESELAAEKKRSKSWCAFITLTFSDSVEWSPDLIAPFIRRVRAWYDRRGVAFRYVWAAELTKRGRMHYHLLFWLPRGLSLPKPDKRGWWPYGMSRIERAWHAGAYLAKYTSKGGADRGDYPKGARIHGTGGLSADSADERRWWLCPKWLRELVPIADRPFRNPGGGFVCRATGELIESAYVVLGIAGGCVRIALRCDVVAHEGN